MRLSEKKRNALYAAISDPVMDLRLAVQKYGAPSGEHLDARLFKMQSDIWRQIHEVLGLDGPA